LRFGFQRPRSQTRNHTISAMGIAKISPTAAASSSKNAQSRQVWRRGSPRWRQSRR